MLGGLPGAAALTSVATIQPVLPPITTTPPSSQLTISTSQALPIPTYVLADSSLQVPALPSCGGVILSPALDPIPQHLVQRIRLGRFVEMQELLSDNIALHDQVEAIQGVTNAASFPLLLRTRQREVTSLISWVYCFTVFIAVQTSDHTAREMLAYCRLIIREALRHGGQGWQEYDRTFRRQREINPSLTWSSLLPDLQAATILGQRQGQGTFCSLCRGSDHSNMQCALASLHQPGSTPLPPSLETSTQRYQTRRPNQPLQPVCTSWNMGACMFPGRCNFSHVCATCSLAHRAKDCADTPEESIYRRGRRRGQGPSNRQQSQPSQPLGGTSKP